MWSGHSKNPFQNEPSATDDLLLCTNQVKKMKGENSSINQNNFLNKTSFCDKWSRTMCLMVIFLSPLIQKSCGISSRLKIGDQSSRLSRRAGYLDRPPMNDQRCWKGRKTNKQSSIQTNKLKPRASYNNTLWDFNNSCLPDNSQKK